MISVVVLCTALLVAGAEQVGPANLDLLDIQLEPVGQGKNIVTLQVRNLTHEPQNLVTDIYTKSPNVGEKGLNWQAQFAQNLGPKERRLCRYAYKLHGKPVHGTVIGLRFYNPSSLAEEFDPYYERHFLERKYTGSEIAVRKPDPSPIQAAPPELADSLIRRFKHIQQLLEEDKYDEAWNTFSKEHQQAGFCGKPQLYKRSMMAVIPESLRVSWSKQELLSLVPTDVARKGNRAVLNARCRDELWTLEFVQEDGQWKLDWIDGYVPPVFRGRWEKRLIPDLEHRATEHFDVYYAKGSTAERHIEEIVQQREAGYEQIREFLRRDEGPRIRLVLFEDEQTKWQETGHRGMGLASGTTMAEVYNETQRLDPYHETTHILARAIGDPPALFKEGLAVYISERLGAPPLKNLGGGELSVYERARELKQKGDWIPLEEVLSYTEIGSAESRPFTSYAEAGAFVKFLTEAHGSERFLEAYETLRSSDQPSVQKRNQKALQRIYGKPLEVLQEEWHAAISLGRTTAVTSVRSRVETGIGYAGYEAEADSGFWAPEVPPRTQYRIDVRLAPEGEDAVLELTETIRLTNDSARAIERLALQYWADACESIDVRIAGKPVTFMTSDGEPSDSPVLFILPSPMAPSDQLEIGVSFSARTPAPEETEGIPLVGWYPRLWWGFPTHDDYDVRLEVPREYAIGTSGRWDPDRERHVIKGVKSFGLFLGKGHRVMEDDADDVHIRVIHTDAGEACAKLLLESALDAVRFYRERFGFYPYSTLTIVPGMDRPAGGYPMATALVAIHGQERMNEKTELHWRWITAHEIGHQYWGEYVLEKDSPGWLWIGLGIYADRKYVRARGLSPRKHHEIMDRYIQGVEQGLDTTLALTEEQYEAVDFDFNNVCIHGKGFSIISALAWLLGQETFDRVYGRCMKEFAGHRLGAAEFQAVCEQESAQDLDWFFDQWVRSNRYLVYEIGSHRCTEHNGKYVSHVEVNRVGTLKMPVPVAAYFQDGTRQLKRTDRILDLNELVFESVAPLSEVRLDPEEQLAMVAPLPATATGSVSDAIRELRWTGAGSRAAELFREARDADVGEPELWGKLGLTLYDGKYCAEALEAFRRTAELSEKKSIWGFVAMVWQGQLLDLMGRREEAVKCYKAALDRDTGETMRHDQYHMRINREWVLERLKTPFQRR